MSRRTIPDGPITVDVDDGIPDAPPDRPPRPVWVIQYLRYYSPGMYEAETLTEAIAVAMGYIDDGYASPMTILGPDGSVVSDKPALSLIYSEQWGVLSTDDIAARLREVGR